ncbi:MAG: hypothetical protein KGJ60_12225 [Verrucomicrobiota bacterium]|nr:hypothetical protein [Verrucomicrobiota bacterium]
MNPNWAEENLQTIRQLMERSALYRRALAPILILAGAAGTLAAVAGYCLKIESPRAFVLYWFGVAVVALAGALLLVRRQALKDREPFWSPPTRRVAQSLLPPLAAGFAIGMAAAFRFPNEKELSFFIALAWVVLYGCALNAAGFFMRRGIRFFGWLFIIGGCGFLALGLCRWPGGMLPPAQWIMGLFFGALHLAYGAYLYLTEKGKKAV